MSKITRRGWLAVAGSASVVAGSARGLPAGNGLSDYPSRGFQNIPPREIIQRRHLPNVELTTQDGRKVLVRYQIDQFTEETFHWQQAFSMDGGETWDVNWIMESTKQS